MKVMLSIRDLSFEQWKAFSENYKSIRILLWFVYNFTENNCCSQLFSNFIQTQKMYPISLDKKVPSIENY